MLKWLQYARWMSMLYFDQYSGLSTDCWKRVLLRVLNDITGGICFFLGLYFVQRLHMSVADAGILVSCYGCGKAFGGYVSGKLSDIISPSIVSIVSLVIKGIAFLCLTQLTTFYPLAICAFTIGAATYGFITSNNVWILQHCADKTVRLRAINIVYTASNFGIGLSSVLLGMLTRFGFNAIFTVCAALLLCSAVYLAFEDLRISRLLPTDKNISRHDVLNLTSRNENQSLVFIMLCCVFIVGLMIAQLSIPYTIFLNDLFPQLGIQAANIPFIINTAMVVLMQTPCVNYWSGYNKVMMSGLGAFLYGMGMIMLCFPFNYSIIIISCVIYTIGEMMFITMAQFVCYEHGPADKKGESMGLYQAAFSASGVLGPITGGYLYYHHGHDIVWYICGILGLICLALCLYYRKLD